MSVEKVITTSGRTYEIHDYAKIDYADDWMYFKDASDSILLGFGKANIEVVIWNDDACSVGSVSDNAR